MTNRDIQIEVEEYRKKLEKSLEHEVTFDFALKDFLVKVAKIQEILEDTQTILLEKQKIENIQREKQCSFEEAVIEFRRRERAALSADFVPNV